MPIYEYECNACGHRLEAIQKFSETPLVDCPKCAVAGLRKLISAPAFRLKGGGWYETDFKSGDKRNIAGDAAAGAGSGSSSSTSEGAGAGGSSGASESPKPAASTGGDASS